MVALAVEPSEDFRGRGVTEASFTAAASLSCDASVDLTGFGVMGSDACGSESVGDGFPQHFLYLCFEPQGQGAPRAIGFVGPVAVVVVLDAVILLILVGWVAHSVSGVTMRALCWGGVTGGLTSALKEAVIWPVPKIGGGGVEALRDGVVDSVDVGETAVAIEVSLVSICNSCTSIWVASPSFCTTIGTSVLGPCDVAGFEPEEVFLGVLDSLEMKSAKPLIEFATPEDFHGFSGVLIDDTTACCDDGVSFTAALYSHCVIVSSDAVEAESIFDSVSSSESV